MMGNITRGSVLCPEPCRIIGHWPARRGIFATDPCGPGRKFDHHRVCEAVIRGEKPGEVAINGWYSAREGNHGPWCAAT